MPLSPKDIFVYFPTINSQGLWLLVSRRVDSFFFVVVPRFIVARLEDCRICRVVYPSVGGQGASLYR